MDITNSDIGGRLREIREIKGYTREQLAEYAEISANFLWEIESGRKSVKVQNLAKLALALNVSTDYLIFGSRQNKPSEIVSEVLSALPDNLKGNFEKMVELFIDTVRSCRVNEPAVDSDEDKQA